MACRYVAARDRERCGPENPISSRSLLVVVMQSPDFLHLDDLAPLHGHPEFEAIVAEVRRRSEAQGGAGQSE